MMNILENILGALLMVALLVVVFVVLPTAAVLGAIWLYVWVWQRLLPRMTSSVAGDRILYWPIAVAIICPLLFALLFQLYRLVWFSLTWELLLIIIGGGLAAIWVSSVILACTLMIKWAAARQWRTAVSTLILPLSFLLVLLSVPFVPPVLWWEAGTPVECASFLSSETATAADCTAFIRNYRYYLARVEKSPAAERRFLLWGGGYSDRGVLYDETDEAASDRPSGAWQTKAEMEGIIRSSERHIIGHFYFVRLRF